MEAEYTAAYADLYRRHWWWRAREGILLKKIRKLLRGRRDVNILDVGCGAGLFFDALDSIGHVEGVESDPVAVQQSGKWRSRIHLGDVASLSSGRVFDAVLLLDVLEHVERPDILLRQASRFLDTHGRMLVTVPAFDLLWTSHDEINHHRKRYTAGDVRRLAREAGLDIIETRYLFQSLVLPKLLTRATETLAASTPWVPSIPSPVVNSALELWFRSEDTIAGWLPFGSSVMAVAQHPHD